MALRAGPIGSSAAATSVPGWKPDDFLRFETNFLGEGVVSGLAVSQYSGGANMSVDVSAGLALIQVTTTLLAANSTLKTWLYSDAVVNVSVPTADSTNPRIDRIVADLDMSVDPNGTASNVPRIRLIQGTPAGSPSAPAEPSNAITLALVSVPASDTTISNGQITDSRTFVQLDASVLADITRVSNLASTTIGKGASLVGVQDVAGHFTGDNVEEVLAEVQVNIDNLTDVVNGLGGFCGDGSDGALNVTSGTTTLDAAGANILLKQYTSINIAVGATLTISNPATDGTILVLLSQGNCTIAGTIDMVGKGSIGATGVTVSRSSNGNDELAGNRGTEPFNRLGQVRTGAPGNGDALPGGQAASGAGGPASTFTAGTASTIANDTGVSAAAASAGDAITTQLIALGAQLGIIIGPGAGGSTGGVAIGCSSYVSGTFSATSGDGGIGGGGLFISSGGNITFTGTINLSGTSATASSGTTGSAGAGSGYAAGGSSGGSSGTGAGFAKGTITNSGTITVNGGGGGSSAAVNGVSTAAGSSAQGAFSFFSSIFQQ